MIRDALFKADGRARSLAKAVRAQWEEPGHPDCMALQDLSDRIIAERGERRPYGWHVPGGTKAEFQEHVKGCRLCDHLRGWYGIRPDGTVHPDGGPLPGSTGSHRENIAKMHLIDALGGAPHRCPFCGGLVWPEDWGTGRG